jgi:phenylpropionate dioxygenase-like ring-hydroxylating dioxygenase large terminal subunit
MVIRTAGLSRAADADEEVDMGKRVSRRDFARTSMAAGAAAVGLPALIAKDAASGETLTAAAAKGAAVARRRRAFVPSPAYGYGGDLSTATAEFRDSIGLAYAQATAQNEAPEIIKGWRVGTTIPAEYYTEEKHYLNDERFIAENFWLMVDHESRIPKPGDYFVFEFGRGDSIIVLRDKAGAVKGYHNVCRHRGSRLCRHDDDPQPTDRRLSVVQLGPSGNTPLFRCPYHAWTYDLDGRLVSAPNGMPADFDFSENGLIRCHIRIAGGFIIANLSRGEPPDFEAVVNPPRTPNWRSVCEEYGTANLKIAARAYYPVKANWKLVMENFHECYHCGPAHKSLVRAHPFWDGTMPEQQRTRLSKELAGFVPPEFRQPAGEGGMSGGAPGLLPAGAILNVGFMTGSLDGKPVAPRLHTKKAWTHRRWSASTTWALGNIQCYDDYVAVVRHTPRDVMLTDVEIFWLVNADAKEGKDYDPKRVMALWDITEQEDRWIVENQVGVRSRAYMPGRYSTTESGPTRFLQWYMKEVALPT